MIILPTITVLGWTKRVCVCEDPLFGRESVQRVGIVRKKKERILSNSRSTTVLVSFSLVPVLKYGIRNGCDHQYSQRRLDQGLETRVEGNLDRVVVDGIRRDNAHDEPYEKDQDDEKINRDNGRHDLGQ